MNVTTVKQPQKRVTTPNLANINVLSYGDDNLYPQKISDIISCSPNGSGCLARYVRFIKGDGLVDESTGNMMVNDNMSVNDLLRFTAEDLGKYGGFAWHLRFNIFGDVSGIKPIPFEYVRLTCPGDAGKIDKVAVFDNWDGQKKKGGKTYKADTTTVTYIDLYKGDRGDVMQDIKDAGGVNEYFGQVFYFANTGLSCYPLPKYDSAVTELSVDEGLSNVKYRNVRCNFLPAGMLLTKIKSTLDDNGDDYNPNSINRSLLDFQGDVNTGKIMSVEYNDDEDKPTFTPFDSKNYDDTFKATEESTTARIYSVFEQDLFYRLRTGSVGFSTEMIKDAFNYYNTCVVDEQSIIVKSLQKVLARWKFEFIMDINIKQLAYNG